MPRNSFALCDPNNLHSDTWNMSSSHHWTTLACRWVLGVVGVAVFAIVIVLGYLLTVYPATYILRWATWGDSNVGDKYRFPSRSMPASSVPYRFRVTSDPESIRSILRAANGGEDFERMLADTGTEALLVLRGDTLLYEGYFNGTRRESQLTSFSVAKSITSALVGIALAEGKLGSLDDPITLYLPELVARDPRFAQVSLRNLITMASGFQYADKGYFPSSDLTLDYEYPDLRTLCREHIKIDEPPGEHWLYNSYLPILMGMVLERATGMSVTQYTQQKLWQPLGMEYEGSWSVDHEPGGMELMEAGVNARAIDFAKFGLLFLENGHLNGRQILPESWTAESTTTDAGRNTPDFYSQSSDVFNVVPPTEKGYYAYWWWGWIEPDGRKTFSAFGKHGQFIFVSRDDRVVIVRNGVRIGRPAREWIAWFQRAAHQIGADNRD